MLAVACALAATCAQLQAQEPDTDDRTPLQRFSDESLDEFSLFGGEALDEPLSIVGRLRWDNNSRGSSSGLTAIYARGGRAEAVVCVYPWQGRLVHYFGTLSRGLVRGDLNAAKFWSPDQPGTEFRAIPDADPPHASESARLLQLKALARERFSALLVGWDSNDSDRAELRLQTRPLYRYEQPEGEVFDGAVFAWVTGVDPEALLLIEAVESDGARRWEYAFAPRTSGALEGRLDGEVVWMAERYPLPRESDPLAPMRAVTRPLPAGIEDLSAVEASAP
jgi:hypothetical protein